MEGSSCRLGMSALHSEDRHQLQTPDAALKAKSVASSLPPSYLDAFGQRRWVAALAAEGWRVLQVCGDVVDDGGAHRGTHDRLLLTVEFRQGKGVIQWAGKCGVLVPSVAAAAAAAEPPPRSAR